MVVGLGRGQTQASTANGRMGAASVIDCKVTSGLQSLSSQNVLCTRMREGNGAAQIVTGPASVQGGEVIVLVTARSNRLHHDPANAYPLPSGQHRLAHRQIAEPVVSTG